MIIYVSQKPVPETRGYRMGKRLEDVEDTRRRITEATVELHGTVGPAHTTISAVADKAGVQRSTVYRHFPNEEALFGACTSHWFARHPWPRSEAWRDEAEPVARFERGFGDLYRYYEENEQLLSNTFRDIKVMPSFVGELMRAQLDGSHAALLEGWPGGGTDGRLSVAVAHAIDFRTWQSLAYKGLGPREAAQLMTTMVACLAASALLVTTGSSAARSDS